MKQFSNRSKCQSLMLDNNCGSHIKFVMSLELHKNYPLTYV